MNKNCIRILLIFGMVLILNLLCCTVSNAALVVTPAKSKVKPGEKFNVTISVASNEAGEAAVSATNGTLSDTSVDLMTQSSVTISCTAGKSGTITISAKGLVANYDTEKEAEQTASNTVKIEEVVTKPEEDNKEEEQTPTTKPEEDNKEEQTPTTKPEEDNNEEEQKPTTPAKSSDTSLKSLSITPFGKISKASSGIYDITVDHSLESVNITAVASHSKAKVLSGNGEFELEEGTNNFKVIVQAEDGSKETHKIRIIRKAEEKVEPITPPNVIDEEKEKEKEEEAKKKEENEFGLTNLIITGIEITPAFDKNVYEYKAEFSEDMDMIEVIATATDEDAEVEVAGDSNLKVGENLVTIIVKSKDGEITKTYQIIVTKNEPETVVVGTADADNVSNTIGTDLTKNQELKEGIGKIVIIAVGAIAAVIVLGIIVIVYTKNKDNDDYEKKTDDKKEKIGKDAFVVAVDEEESYRELEKLSNLRNKNNDYEEDVEEEAKNNFKEEFAEEISVDNDDEFHEVASEKIKKSKGKRFK